ncbi:MAG: protein kinase [Thermoanaerobaculia bacterium]|nr:protein kinase [Thermoanaerobaculia bacterium]
MIGRTIGHYRILERLGGGGMGVVYKAEDLTLHRTVALKFLPPELTRDDDAKQRFLFEARAAAQLEHPNVCPVYEIAESDDGQTFIAMAYYEGESLAKRIERGALGVEEAAKVAVEVARGSCGLRLRAYFPAGSLLTRRVPPRGIGMTRPFTRHRARYRRSPASGRRKT